MAVVAWMPGQGERRVLEQQAASPSLCALPPSPQASHPPAPPSSGGVRTGGYPKCSPLPGPLGFQRGGDWDMLWSPARTALKAVPELKPGQLVSALPGMMSITKKVGPGAGAVLLGGPGWARALPGLIALRPLAPPVQPGSGTSHAFLECMSWGLSGYATGSGCWAPELVAA